MGRGGKSKSHLNSCLSKAKFDSAEEAEATSQYRFGAYRCHVCGYYHLTRQLAAKKPTTVRDPRVGDVTAWPIRSAVQTSDEAARVMVQSEEQEQRTDPIVESHSALAQAENCHRLARVLGWHQDRRAILVIEGQIIKSRKCGFHPSGPWLWVSEENPPLILREAEPSELAEPDS